jgi:DNA polymerase III subunit epsilon
MPDIPVASPTTIWGRPVTAPGAGWAVIDVETSGFRPGNARVISLAVLALDAEGQVEQSVVSLLNPGVDPGPTHVHGLTAAMLEDQPQFADIVGDVVELLRGRTLVAHNVAFDYAFLTAEAEMADVELPIDTVMCTVELARRLELGIDNLRLETLAAHWGVTQRRPHDAFDDAVVLTNVLAAALDRARERDVWLPVRSVTRRRWPSGRVTHDELRPLKVLPPGCRARTSTRARTSVADRWSRACGWRWRLRSNGPMKSWSSGFCTPGWPTPKLSIGKPRW